MKKYIFLFLVTWLLASCSNFLEEYSQDQAKVESYKDLDELLIGDGYWRPHTFYTEGSTPMETGDPFLLALHLMPDEVDVYQLYKPSLELQEDFFGYITWQEQVGKTFKGSATFNDEDKDWNELYKRINIANQIIGEIDKQEAADDRERLEILRVKGEAFFLRACYYFTLVNMYARPYNPATAATEAGIPLKLSQDIEDKEYTSSSLQEVYAVILDDLREARECLGQTEVKNHPYRADIVAAHLLTSRVCLYMQEWQNAYNHADSVINRKGVLEDLNGYEGNFLNRRSKETIFSMGGHILSTALQNKSNFPNFVISDDMVSLYDESDLRRGTYIREMTPVLTGSNGKGSPVWVYNKVNGVQVYEGGSQAYETGDFYLMRNAEAYLNAAEAAAYLGKTTEAADKLRELRRHRVESDNADYGGDLVTFIREERARELLLEGHRWFDLRRYMVAPKPYSKQITHYYTDFNTGSSRNPQPYATTQYTLLENDPAYTLALPKEVTEFQNTLPSVVRPPRPGRPYDQFAGKDMAEEGQRDGTRAGEAAAKADSEAGRASQSNDRNPLYYDFYNGDYQQFKDYKDAYNQAFKVAYEANYVEKEDEGDPDEGDADEDVHKSEAYWTGFKNGMDTGMTDESYGDDYDPENWFYTEVYDDEWNVIADYDGDEDYLEGWYAGYDDGYNLSPAKKAERDAKKYLEYKNNGGTKEETEVLDFLKRLYFNEEEQEEYETAWNDYMNNL